MTITDVMKYLKPGAIVPVDVQTTALLVNALREALASQGEALAEQLAQQELASASVEPVAVIRSVVHSGDGGVRVTWLGGFPQIGDLLYTSPPATKSWVGLTDEEIDQGLLRSDYAFKTAEAWRAGVVFAMTKLKEKNCG